MHRAFRGAITVGVALAFLGGATAAQAAPSPSSGPTAGGTSVTVEAPAEPTFVQIDAGYLTSLALTADGTLFAWGSNAQGVTGTGLSDTTVPNPTLVLLPEGVSAVAFNVGLTHALAIGDDGVTYAWGNNDFGQLGDGSTTAQATPVAVQLPSGVTFTDVYAGDTFSLALGDDGNLYAWGFNGFGALGNGTSDNSSVPTLVQQPENVTFTKVSTFGGHVVAIGSDGNTYAWGLNTSGQLGDGTTSNRAVPTLVNVPNGVTFVDVEAGHTFTAALGNDGKIYVWGDGGFGQGGNGTTTGALEPMAANGTGYTSIDVGSDFIIAAGTDGEYWGWGRNTEAQTSYEPKEDLLVPTLLPALTDVGFSDLALGGVHALGLSETGQVYAWGSQFAGQLGDGIASEDESAARATPEPISNTLVVTEVQFDGVPGTELTQNDDGTVTVVTPAHPGGPVDVTVQWTFNGVAQAPVVFTDGFLYGAVPTITGPADQTVEEGQDAVFAVEVSGDPEPSVTWEYTVDGQTWLTVADVDGITVSEDGLTITVEGLPEFDGAQFRAIASSTAGEATSEPATLTIATDVPGEVPGETPGETPGENVVDVPTAETGLAQTGSDALPALLIGAAALLALGTAGIAIARARKTAAQL